MSGEVQQVTHKPITFSPTIDGVDENVIDNFSKLIFEYKNISKEDLSSLINLDGWDLDNSGSINTKEEFNALKEAVDNYVKLDKRDKARKAEKELLKAGKSREYITAVTQDVENIKVSPEGAISTFNNEWINTNSMKNKKIDMNNVSIPEILCAIKKGTLSINKKSFERGFCINDNDGNRELGKLIKRLNTFALENGSPKALYYEHYTYSAWVIFYANKNDIASHKPPIDTQIKDWNDVNDITMGIGDLEIGGQMTETKEYDLLREFALDLYNHINKKREEYGFEKFPY